MNGVDRLSEDQFEEWTAMSWLWDIWDMSCSMLGTPKRATGGRRINWLSSKKRLGLQI
jgi:hypothetical protein